MIVDDNYKYDELDGFEILDMKRQAIREELIQISVHESTLVLSDTAFTALGEPEYIRFRVNPDRQLLLIERSVPEERQAVYVRPRSPQCKKRRIIGSRILKQTLEKLTKRDLGTVNMVVTGRPMKQIKDAAVFDLRTASYSKKRFVGAAKTKKETR